MNLNEDITTLKQCVKTILHTQAQIEGKLEKVLEEIRSIRIHLSGKNQTNSGKMLYNIVESDFIIAEEKNEEESTTLRSLAKSTKKSQKSKKK